MAKSRRRRKNCGYTHTRCLLASTPRSLRYESLEDRRLLAVVIVDTHLDAIDFNDGVTSLREAIFATNLVDGADEIQFDFRHDGPKTIFLTLDELAITDSLAITGPGAELLTIDASGNDPTPDSTPLDDDITDDGDGSRIFNIERGIEEQFQFLNSAESAFTEVEEENLVTISGLSLTGGDAEEGGAILTAAEELTLIEVSIHDNHAAGDNGGGRGGGIYVFQPTSLSIISSTIRDNVASRNGGGIYSDRVSQLSVIDTDISNNIAMRSGGGIRATGGDVLIEGSTINDNTAFIGSGGGIRVSGHLTITASTISGNTASLAGGGVSASYSVISFSMINDNTASLYGGGVFATDHVISSSTISGNTAGQDGGGVFARYSAMITSSTISGNEVSKDGGGVFVGGGDRAGTATIIDSIITGNDAVSSGEYSDDVRGGGIFSYRPLTLTRSNVTSNSAITSAVYGGDSRGGGIYSNSSALAIDSSTISGNYACSGSASYHSAMGGGIFSKGNTTTITRSTLSGNLAIGANAIGGGLYHRRGGFAGSDILSITSSTISDNTTDGNGGGIYFHNGSTSFSATANIAHSTIVYNRANQGMGGGIFMRGGPLNLNHVIIAENRATFGSDLTGLLGTQIDTHFSLIGDNSASGLIAAPVGSPDANGNLIGQSEFPGEGIIRPQLAPLSENGGPTLTHALFSRSPAINAGDPIATAGTDEVPMYDQRGAPFTRVFGGRIDIGAVETQDFGSPLNLIVDTVIDERDGDLSKGDLSLREAIGLANANVGHVDTIVFDTSLAESTIWLSLLGDEDRFNSSHTKASLVVTDSVVIQGLGAESLTIDASGVDPSPDQDNGDGVTLFRFSGQSGTIDVTISGLTLTGADSEGLGGAIFSSGKLTARDMNIIGNAAQGSGGGIFSSGTKLEVANSLVAKNNGRTGGGIYATAGETSIVGSTIIDNYAEAGGGAFVSLSLFHPAMASIVDSTIANNSSLGNAGGLVLWAPTSKTSALVKGSALSGNHAGGSGGGVWTVSPFANIITFESTTISKNSAVIDGGGVFLEGYFLDNERQTLATFRKSTIYGNIADVEQTGAGTGGGIFSNEGVVGLDHVILAGNVDGSGTAHDLTISNHPFGIAATLVGDNTGSGLTEAPIGSPDTFRNLIGQPVSQNGSGVIDPLLGPLADNGGPTLTHALLPGSPAIDAGDPALQQGDSGLPEFDQRGAPFARIAGGRIDIGAFEVQPATGSLSGDFDNDRDTDGSDFLAWQRGFGLPSGAVFGNGDATGDGDVDGNDGAVWEATFGQFETTPMVVAATSGESELESSFVSIEAPTEIALAVTRATASCQLVDAAMVWELAGVISEQEEPAVDESQAFEEVFRDVAFADEDNAATGLVSSSEDLLGTSSSESELSEIEWLTDELLELIFG